ncbi:hypothetical protein SLIQ_05225 [Serratia liquefaciens FK01]|nr:hypothetical protein SLIQ_05225 [Serratia liquefaciens FK01]
MQINPGALYDNWSEKEAGALCRTRTRVYQFCSQKSIIKPTTLPTELIAHSIASERYYPY